MCEFCEQGKRIKAEDKGNGIETVLSMLNSLMTMFGSTPDDSVGIAHIENGMMWVDNSGGEYAELGFKIDYCPFCGEKLNYITKDNKE